MNNQNNTSHLEAFQKKSPSMKNTVLLLLFASVLIIGACKKQTSFTPVCDGSSPTYDANIKAIIDQSCVSCHGNYSSYSGLSSDLSNGKFEKEVLTKQTMPQSGSLTEAQLNTVKCWVENGFPEN